MLFVPYENYVLKTCLSEDEVLRRVAHITASDRNVFTIQDSPSLFNGWEKPEGKLYTGDVYGHKFSLERIISYRNSFLPKIKGVITRGFDGVEVEITMRPSWFVIVFIIFWMGFLGVGLVVSLMSTEISADLPRWFPLLMMALGYLLTLGGFKYESSQSKAHFRKLFEASSAEH